MNVLITGASSGIGFALAQHYLGQGHKVWACGRNHQRLAQLSGAQPLVFDITDQTQVAHTAKLLPNLDLVIFNAGDCEYIDDALHFDAQLFERIIRVNLLAVAYGLQAWLDKINRHGRVVFISSAVVFLPLPRAQAYGASKAALSYLAQSLALDLARHQIAVSLVHPGFVQTPLTAKNDFAMPMAVSAEQAACYISGGIEKGKSVINFPWLFIALQKSLGLLPFRWWRRLVLRMM